MFSGNKIRPNNAYYPACRMFVAKGLRGASVDAGVSGTRRYVRALSTSDCKREFSRLAAKFTPASIVSTHSVDPRRVAQGVFRSAHS